MYGDHSWAFLLQISSCLRTTGNNNDNDKYFNDDYHNNYINNDKNNDNNNNSDNINKNNNNHNNNHNYHNNNNFQGILGRQPKCSDQVPWGSTQVIYIFFSIKLTQVILLLR